MIQRPSFSRWIFVAILLALALAMPRIATAFSWPVKIQPPGSGTVTWATSSPPANGVLDTSGEITVDANASLDMTFEANPGYALFTVFKDSDNWTFLLDANGHFQFGPVSRNHKIVATFFLVSPTGSFEFPFPTDNPLVTAIAFLTGNYTGTMPGPFSERTYDFDVAMDEDGKLEVMGTAEAIEPAPGGDPLGGAGQVKTLDGQPMAQAKVKFEGTVDGVPASANASGESPLEVKDLGGMPGIEGTHTYNASFGGVKFKDKDRPFQVELDPPAVDNIAKAWSLTLDISDQVNPKNGKLSYVADAQLTLQNGDMIVFPQKKAKYSAKKGYSLSFSKGTNVTAVPPTLVKKAKINIKNLTFVQNGPDFEPTGGTIQYKFFGQKGKANLLDFVVP